MQHKELNRGVYFIFAPNQNKIKIGRSSNIEIRFKNLKTGFMDQAVLLLGIITEKEKKLEKSIHQEFSHLRCNGEWFYLTQELELYLNNCTLFYDNVIVYKNINEIKRIWTCGTLGLYKVVEYINKLKPTVFYILFLTISIFFLIYYNYLNRIVYNPEFKYIGYLFFLIYPIQIPIIAKHVFKSGRILTRILYIGIMLSSLILELIFYLFQLNESILYLWRIGFQAIYPFFMFYILFFVQKEEMNNKAHVVSRAKFETDKDLYKTLEKFKNEVNIAYYIRSKKRVLYFTYFFALFHLYICLSGFFSLNRIVTLLTVFNIMFLIENILYHKHFCINKFLKIKLYPPALTVGMTIMFSGNDSIYLVVFYLTCFILWFYFERKGIAKALELQNTWKLIKIKRKER